MTILEAFQLKSGNLLTNEKAAVLLQFQGLNPDSIWDNNNENFKCPFYSLLLSELGKDESDGIKSITEGGFKVEYDKSEKENNLYKLALESECSSLIDKYNPSPEPVVENKSYLW